MIKNIYKKPNTIKTESHPIEIRKNINIVGSWKVFVS